MVDFSAVSLEGRVAVVTGGLGGLGAGAVESMTALGAHVYVLDKAPLGTAPDVGCHVGRFSVDVRNRAAIREAFDEIVEREGRLDVLVNAHGVRQDFSSVEDTRDAEYERVMSINTYGAFLTCGEAARVMKPNGFGRIVNLASQAARAPWPDLGIYGASKAAVVAMTQTLATELGRYGITANAICPGVMLTDMTEKSYADISNSTGRPVADLLAEKAATLPVRRLGHGGDVGGLAAWLASDASSFMTGATLNLTGGEQFF
ncbi:SDR family oxidoreductase [Cryobacterium sp. TMS1-20-1]|uniref:SDR family NAD(P)-dependent oxidoreductase n=1 Tax=Cryobacterium sp. TMS1-20-1 TaxID=1259223 RepID=UPI00106C068C|nr:SDR family oxidoreductase [Cryobacterium sp. TMS1-20-1]TFC80538.1 SDR family oxidoreductase [Cryobacterium sp. TMS1-20-1]